MPRAEVEFDRYAHNGTAYLVEVKSHIKATEVFAFYRKVKFAEQKLERAVIPLILALSAGANAELRMDALGIRYRIGFQA